MPIFNYINNKIWFRNRSSSGAAFGLDKPKGKIIFFIGVLNVNWEIRTMTSCAEYKTEIIALVI